MYRLLIRGDESLVGGPLKDNKISSILLCSGVKKY